MNVTDRATYGGDATQAVDYIYDVNNQLVGKILDPDGAGEESACEEYYAYDRGQILFRFDGPSRSDMTDRYLWGPAVDLLLCDEKVTGPSTAGDIYWTLGDNVNTIRDITHYDPATDKTLIVNHRAFDAFGNLMSETNSAIDLLFAFTGRQFDESTNLQNNLNRWYDAVVGRWMSEDPIGYKGGINLYQYVGNSPLNATDPTGRDITVETGNDTWNPVNNAVHQSVCVDTWTSCNDDKPSGKRCFSFGKKPGLGGLGVWIGGTWLGWDSWKCCILTGRVYEANVVAGATVARRKKTTCAEDREFLRKMLQMERTDDGYSIARHGCRNFSGMAFDDAPGTEVKARPPHWRPAEPWVPPDPAHWLEGNYGEAPTCPSVGSCGNCPASETAMPRRGCY